MTQPPISRDMEASSILVDTGHRQRVIIAAADGEPALASLLPGGATAWRAIASTTANIAFC